VWDACWGPRADQDVDGHVASIDSRLGEGAVEVLDPVAQRGLRGVHGGQLGYGVSAPPPMVNSSVPAPASSMAGNTMWAAATAL